MEGGLWPLRRGSMVPCGVCPYLCYTGVPPQEAQSSRRAQEVVESPQHQCLHCVDVFNGVGVVCDIHQV